MRVAVVVHREEGSQALALWARRVARALEADLSVVWVADGSRAAEESVVTAASTDEELAGCPTSARGILALLSISDGSELHADDPGAAAAESAEPVLAQPSVELVVPAVADERIDHLAASVLEFLERRDVDLALVAPPKQRRRQVSLARRLFTDAPCRIVLFHVGGTDGSTCRDVLVPTAGGPSARRALILGQKLAAAEGRTMEALYVEPSAVPDGEDVGLAILRRALEAAGVEHAREVEPRVVLGDDLPAVIDNCIEDRHDLVLLGASHVGVVRGLLFGTVPERLLSRPGGVAVGVVREGWGLGDRLRARVGRWLDLRIPQLGRAQRVDLYQRIQSGSEWSFDFMLLIALSTSIAALGLVQNSAAVVIGAMLVAPLMTPILGIGLALLQGNGPLLRDAGRAVVSGYLLALLLGVLVGWVAGPATPTSELAARGGPTLLDMGVAFLSGLAAAYCLGRPGLLAALPGVAIAAALVPPIATTGIAVARGQMELAEGASLLFGTNVVAIVLGAAVSLYAVGVRARAQPTKAQRRTRLLVAILFVVLAALAVPLTERWFQSQRPRLLTEGQQQSLRTGVEAAGFRYVEARWQDTGDDRHCRVTIASDRPFDPDAAQRLVGSLAAHLPEGSKVRLVTELVVRSD